MTPDESSTLLYANLGDLPLHARGKVRDTYDLGDRLFMVASDRISTYDSVHPTPIPDKGRVLTQLSLFWFDKLSGIVDNHLISADVADFPDEAKAKSSDYAGRSMVVTKSKVIPLECVVRGYLSGSGWKSYQRDGTVCDITLPAGLVESDKLPEPLFTPSTKAETGHDENIGYGEAEELVGADVAAKLKDYSLALYQTAADYAAKKGIIIADTKFEFGYDNEGAIILVDEVLTPDSSRFWPAESYEPGRSQPSFDKQYVRDYATKSGWDKEPPAPKLPSDVVAGTTARYREAHEKITGHPLS